MTKPPIPTDEIQRLAALERYDVIDTPAEAAFERTARLAARLFEAPIAMVTFIDRDRQWFKACVGTDLRENTRALSFCSHTILDDEIMVVPNALEDERFHDNPVVIGLGIRFYAGVPLRSLDGRNVGTLCIYDVRPRPTLSAAQRETLTDLAAIVIDDLEARLIARRALDSERELAERLVQLEALNAAQRRFVADASHELRTPLTLIQGNIELVQRHPNLDLTERTLALNEAVRGTERLGRLVTDLLHLARNDVAATEDRSSLDFAQLVRTSVDRSRPLATHHALGARFESTGRVLGHPDRLEQLVLILIDNACKYTPAPGRIEVLTRDVEGELELSVQDSGVGIDSHELGRVFERLYRSRGARAGDSGGTGLGLPIARAIAESHGGRIWLESEPGRGTRAVVRLPREP
jgi:signal transduction histidine kinase